MARDKNPRFPMPDRRNESVTGKEPTQQRERISTAIPTEFRGCKGFGADSASVDFPMPG